MPCLLCPFFDTLPEKHLGIFPEGQCELFLRMALMRELRRALGLMWQIRYWKDLTIVWRIPAEGGGYYPVR